MMSYQQILFDKKNNFISVGKPSAFKKIQRNRRKLLKRKHQRKHNLFLNAKRVPYYRRNYDPTIKYFQNQRRNDFLVSRDFFYDMKIGESRHRPPWFHYANERFYYYG